MVKKTHGGETPCSFPKHSTECSAVIVFVSHTIVTDSESESDDADPNFEIYSDHDTESEFDLDEVCEPGQLEEESDNEAGLQREDNTDDQLCEESRDININLPGPSTAHNSDPVRQRREPKFMGKDKKQNG
ncbi:hypothetical protein J6590_095148 [Homalodisca vitripennis]|nr:hypothetical protein J6590_056442 [Homalodisca vitripennis]KAG8269986.1 hypothetical protein J6590_095148 [Homalodisca vitripennis]